MMRIPAFLAMVAALTALPSVLAQDGCEETAPCLWVVDVDDQGIRSISQANFTQGDWFQLSVCNVGDATHTLSLEGHDLSLEVPSGDCLDSEGFGFDQAGTFDLTDDPSGDLESILVIEGDVVDYEDEAADQRETEEGGDEAEDNDTPGPALALVAAGLLAVAAWRRR